MDGDTDQTDVPKDPLPLNRTQRRVVGVLIEKAFTTPEYYPLTVNALVNGCNQKSNRSPVTNLEAHQVDEALLELRELGLVTCVMPATGRIERWKHRVKDAWDLDRPERAALAELLLRGAQTEGELRSRASRMAEIASLDDLHAILGRLSERGFVRRLSPEGQKRGVVWTHLLMPEAEAEAVRRKYAEVPPPGPEPAATSAPARDAGAAALTERVTRLEHELEETRSLVSDLSRQLAQTNMAQQGLERELQNLRDELGA